MSGLGSYFRVGRSEDSAHGDNQLELSSHPPSIEDGDFAVKIFYKEKTYVIESGILSSSSTIGELKCKCESMCGVSVHLIRLIYGGRMLNPDDKTLGGFGLPNGAVVHLFPKVIPVATPQTEIQHAIQAVPAVAPVQNATPFAGNVFAPDPSLTLDQIHLDPYIAQTCREVRLWSLLLFFFSSLTCINNLSQLSAQGYLGDTTFDSFVQTIDTICSILGIYVSNLGLVSSRSAELVTIKKYVWYLVCVAGLSIVYRILWTFDIIWEVQKILSMSSESDDIPENAPSPAIPSRGSSDSLTDDKGKVDISTEKSNILTTYTLRAVTITLICIFAWISCVVRGWRLQIAVAAYHDAASASSPTATATATATAATATTSSASEATVVHNPLTVSSAIL